jgi:hypothetical protein
VWNPLIGGFANVPTGLNCRALAGNDDLIINRLTDNSPCNRGCGRAALACHSTGYTCRRRASRANGLWDTEEIARARQRLVHGCEARSIDGGRLGEQSRVHVQDKYLIGTRGTAGTALVPDMRQGTPGNGNLS